ncbi:biotin--[acetyl-CoA-carboxylase] ligase [Methylocystis bryophila]|uniref:biotin--[biotin carboxyl-carrier protein] ligase n=1 Tax=Methylocystis bryophila TaxID=655015 RepID=A0A1W6N0I7_9HYPH|nr:biotin--[acetyl-CoA-carboxylase] ligase [Methylocystis bryophila]
MAEQRFALGDKAHADGVRLLSFDELDSTNEEARRRVLEEGEHGPLWIVAGRQSRGRGRLGREWLSVPGNLHASLILSDGVAPERAPQLGFVAGVAIVEALRALCPGETGFALKWPNDILLDRAKLGGVLLEGLALSAGDERQPASGVVVVGIGVNCSAAPEGLAYPAAALTTLGARAPSAQTLFRTLSDRFCEALKLWAAGSGFAEIRRRWLEAAAGLGETVHVLLAQGEEIEGRFETIDASGRLVIAVGAARRAIDAGDVALAHRAAFAPTGQDSRL